ncbi:MAG: peptidoglycan-binding domain-containing protein [Solirubrobacteraceae bacterium]|nr:peptidoglycan-binding domain-containing protein [Patulibacter sp.]
MKRRFSLLALLVAAVAVGLPGVLTSGAEAKTKAPVLLKLRCVPASLKACKSGVHLTVGQQLQLSGHGFKRGMRVSFRWSKGALATKLAITKTGWTARVPTGTTTGKIAVTVMDSAGRRSNKLSFTVIAPQPVAKPATTTATGDLPAVFAGNGMWIWYVNKSEGGDLAKIAAQAKAADMDTVYVKSADGGGTWSQFTPALVAGLHALGLKVCGWQFVYGTNPTAEASAAAASQIAGADCFVIDAEGAYEGKYKSAQTYMTALRAAVGPDFPIGLTSFPYVSYHPKLPYSVFLGPGGAQANLPQDYWKDIGGTVDAVSAKTVADNRIYGTPIAPLGQTYSGASTSDLARFRSIWAGYGAKGLSWWDWQETTSAQWASLQQPQPTVVPADPGWPALSKGNAGDQVLWLKEHLAAADPSVPVDDQFTAATTKSVMAFQTARGLPATGETDAATWQALLTLAPVMADFS